MNPFTESPDDERSAAADTSHLPAPSSPHHNSTLSPPQICPSAAFPSGPPSVPYAPPCPTRPSRTLSAAAEPGRDGGTMDGMSEPPSDSNIPRFFRWCLSGMAAFASGSAPGTAPAPDSARDAGAAKRILRLGKEVELECGDISASQEDLLARAPFLSGSGGEEEEAEVFSTPPLTQSQQSQQFQGEGEEEEEEDAITMCSLPFSQPPPSSPSITSSEGEDKEEEPPAGSKLRKPRICRKVRGARIRTPTPSPSPSPSPSPDNRRSSSCSSIVDPLYRAVLMIPTDPVPPTAAEDLLALARNHGIF